MVTAQSEKAIRCSHLLGLSLLANLAAAGQLGTRWQADRRKREPADCLSQCLAGESRARTTLTVHVTRDLSAVD